MKNIAVIGAGTMGNGIAHVFAQNGFKVNLIDISEDALKQAIDTISKNLDRMLAKEKITQQIKEQALSNLSTFSSMELGVKNCDLIIEAATENIDLKCKIFRDLDKFSSEKAILATNTSSISITQIAAQTKRPEKVIGMHFMNPVPVMKLIEVIRGYLTSDEVTKTVFELSIKLGKIPVEVNDYPGFIANRILMPMINEAIHSLYEGVATVNDIDTIMKLGMAHPMGPLQLADFIGLDTCLSIMRVLHSGFGNPKYSPCALLVNMVEARHLGVKTGIGFYDYTSLNKEIKIAPRFR